MGKLSYQEDTMDKILGVGFLLFSKNGSDELTVSTHSQQRRHRNDLWVRGSAQRS